MIQNVCNLLRSVAMNFNYQLMSIDAIGVIAFVKVLSPELPVACRLFRKSLFTLLTCT
jgi:hypothetical protein